MVWRLILIALASLTLAVFLTTSTDAQGPMQVVTLRVEGMT